MVPPENDPLLALPGLDDEPRWESAPIAVSAVIPCLNEALTIGLCVEKALRSFAALHLKGEVVVADNGSTDGSVDIAGKLGARVVHERRKGYGSALRRGIEESRGEIVIMADADDSYDWSAIEPFVRKIREGYDLVIGNRFKGGIMRGAMPRLHRYLGNPVLSFIGRSAFRINVGDFHCGMRAFTRRAFDQMRLQATGMEFATEMVANAAHQGLRIAEIPIILYPDKRDRAPHLRSFRDGWRHLRFILTYAPDHLYVIPGLAMLLVGIGLETFLIRGPRVLEGYYLGIHFLALGSLLTLVGFNLLNMGVLAKTLMSQRLSGLKSWTVALMRREFSLEAGLIAGTVLALVGTVVDCGIAAEWFGPHGREMDSSVHLAFVATTAIVLGLNLICSSFLLNMILQGFGRARGAPRSRQAS